jgi:Mg2+/Co2+ transporter CorB
MQYIPQKGEFIQDEGLKFTVLTRYRNRIKDIKIEIIKE